MNAWIQGHFRHLNDRGCVHEPRDQQEMPRYHVGIGDRSGRLGTDILSENLEEHSGQLGDNARKQLDLADIGAY